ncbi:unnamed protein product [Vicia faba]|uniref:DUF7913 domain-containing protein n=1 Tax=Vicia faba TaxID=3906 RepID=A0AAV1A6S9_VICFA|nr:unnamed protein product [Vicia faba]
MHFYEENGIQRKFSMRKTPQHNGVEEMMNMTLAEKARYLRLNTSLPKGLWEVTLKMACYLNKTSPYASLNGKVEKGVWTTGALIILGMRLGFWISSNIDVFTSRVPQDTIFSSSEISSKNMYFGIQPVYLRLYHILSKNVIELGFVPLAISSLLHPYALEQAYCQNVPTGDDPPLSQQQRVAKHVHSAVLRYNYYHKKQHPELAFVAFEEFCKLAVDLSPTLLAYLKFTQKPDQRTLLIWNNSCQ